MELNISKEQFEFYVPAFRSPTGEIWTKMNSCIGEEIDRWSDLVGASPTLEEATLACMMRAVCLRAAYEAVPAMDLVITPTGFGIVSNQTTAPASRDRVEALREQLRRDASRTEDQCMESLLAAGQLLHPSVVVNSLFWNASIMRRYGVTTPSGRRVFREEREMLLPDLFHAEMQVVTVISPELYGSLVVSLQNPAPADDLHRTLIDNVRRVLAALLQKTSAPRSPMKDQMRSLLDFVQKHADQFPEYATSRTAEAHKFKRYENQKDDPCYFFC